MMSSLRVAIAHDYLTQRGGAERVVLTMARAFPRAPIYTSVYDKARTYPEFKQLDVRTSRIQRVPYLHRNHRYGFALYPTVFSRMAINADVVICSSSGWAHGVTTPGAKMVYCYTPARWLYAGDSYVDGMPRTWKYGLRLMRRRLLLWDRKAVESADCVVTTSTYVQSRIKDVWNVEAAVLPPPVPEPPKTMRPLSGVAPGYFLVVSRLLPYKGIDSVIEAVRLTRHRLIVVGDGPIRSRLEGAARACVTFLSNVTDAELAWLYTNCIALVSAAEEDFGLTPLEANLYGKPAVCIKGGGFLDTVNDGTTGILFDDRSPRSIATAMERARVTDWNPRTIREHGSRYDEHSFITRMRQLAEALHQVHLAT